MAAPSCLVDLAVEAFAEVNDAWFGDLKKRASEAGSFLELLGLSAIFIDNGEYCLRHLSSLVKKQKRILIFLMYMSNI